MKYAYKILAGKPERQRLLEGRICWWESNIKMGININRM